MIRKSGYRFSEKIMLKHAPNRAAPGTIGGKSGREKPFARRLPGHWRPQRPRMVSSEWRMGLESAIRYSLLAIRGGAGDTMAWPDGRYIQASIFFSRWLLAPFLLGLLLCLFVLMYRFFGDVFELIVQAPRP